MTAHDWFIEHRTEYAARVLDAADMATFDAHLPNCEECQRAIAIAERELAWLPMGAEPATPRPGLHRRIIEHALGTAAPRRIAWAVPASLAAALLIAIAGFLTRDQQARSLRSQLAERDARLAALEDTISIDRQAATVMQAKFDVDGRAGGMVVFADAKTHRWNVVVHGLPTAPPDGRYQFWFVCADGMVRGAVVHVDPSKPMIFTTGMPATGGAVMGAALTMEPMSATAGPPQGRELAKVML